MQSALANLKLAGDGLSHAEIQKEKRRFCAMLSFRKA